MATINDLSAEAITSGANAPQTDSTPTMTDEEGNVLVYSPSDIFQGEDVKEAIRSYLSSEIIDVRDGSDRSDLEERWRKWRLDRRARPETDSRESVWEDAANVVPPLTAQKVNTIYAKEVAAFTSKKPPVDVEAMSLEDSERAESLKKLFKGLAESRNGLNMPKNIQTIFYEQVSMGTHFVKVPFLVDRWAFKRTSAEGGSEQVNYVRHQGPAVVSIRLEDFFTRPYWKDIQRAPWIAIRYRYFKHELQQQVAMGAFDPVETEKIYSQNLTEYDDNTLSSLSSAGVNADSVGKAEPNKEYEIYECYVFWDADGDGIPEDIKVWIEPDTGVILRSEFNPLSIRDVEPVIYFEDPDVLYAVGVCEMCEQMQEEVSTLHNMRIDGTHLAMLKLWFARRGSGLTSEKFHPMMIKELDDPIADLRVVDFPDVAPSCINGEMIAREYADKVTGASDYMAGFNDKTVGSNATVGGTMFLAQQSNSILNNILKNAEISISNIYQIAFYQCVANKEKLDLSFLDDEDQRNVMEVLSMKVEDIPTKFRFSVKATDISKTDEARKQNFLAMAQLYGSYGEKMIQLAQLQANPQLTQIPMAQELMLKLMVGSTDFMGKMMEYFDVGNPSDYLPYTEHLKVQMKAYDDVREEQMLAQKEAMKNGTTGIGGEGGLQLGGQPGAMPALGALGTGGAAVPPGPPAGAQTAGIGVQPGAVGGAGPIPGAR